MAKCTLKLPTEFENKISRLGKNADEIVTKALKSGGEVVESEVRSSLSSVIGKDTKGESRSTGQLLLSLGTSSVRQGKDGNLNIKVGFSENRRDGKKNGMIANILEYGRSNQKARPFIKPAKRKAQKRCIEVMENVVKSEAEKI